jgi:hypothetical protein
MPVLPKRPTVLLHFDQLPTDYRTDIVSAAETAGTIGSSVILKNIDSIRGHTLQLNNKSVTIKDNTNFNISESFTVRYWENVVASAGWSVTPFCFSVGSAVYGLALYHYSGQLTAYASSHGANWNLLSGLGLGASSYGQWVSWEIGYDADTKKLYFFKNGVLLTSPTLAAPLYYNPEGSNSLGSGGLNTAIADFDFISGVCEHTMDFTPEPIHSMAPTKPIHPMVTDIESKFGGGSLYTNGANYLSFPVNSFVLDTTKDFTISFWEYWINGINGTASLAINAGDAAGNIVSAILLGYNNTGNKYLYCSTGAINDWNVASAVLLESLYNLVNRWTHWEVCYKSSTKTLYVFLDGELKHSVICPTPLRMSSPNYHRLGYWSGSQSQIAYYDEFLILPGVCLHTDNFIPPAEPYSFLKEADCGISLQPLSQGTKDSSVFQGEVLQLMDGTPAAKDSEGKTIDWIDQGLWHPGNFWGKQIQPLLYSNQITVPEITGIGMFISDGSKDLAQYPGKITNWLYRDSNESYKFNLLVTPTHIYKNQLAHVVAKYKLPQGLTGKYQLKVKDEVAIPWGASTDISTVDFNITQSMLEYGKNPCRLEYLYPDGHFKYLDFEVTREEPQRTRIERTFKKYDGGYDGNYMRSAPNWLSASPCFLVPNGQKSTLIKTTDFTKVPLQKYTGVQGVQIDAAGAKILVTFDEGLTYKSLIDNSWQTVSLDNIAEVGMSTELINSIIFARWLEIFQPESLDFAIYLDNSIDPSVANIVAPPVLLNSSNFTYTDSKYDSYTRPGGWAITHINYYLQGRSYGSGSSSATVSTINEDGTNTTIFALGHNDNRSYSGTAYYNDPLQYNRAKTVITGLTRSTGQYHSRTVVIQTEVFGVPSMAYLKSIIADITPRLKTGYAFIM